MFVRKARHRERSVVGHGMEKAAELFREESEDTGEQNLAWYFSCVECLAGKCVSSQHGGRRWKRRNRQCGASGNQYDWRDADGAAAISAREKAERFRQERRQRMLTAAPRTCLRLEPAISKQTRSSWRSCSEDRTSSMSCVRDIGELSRIEVWNSGGAVHLPL